MTKVLERSLKMTRKHQSSIRHHVRDFKRQKDIINTLKNRFMTYGYEQIEIPTYESYDLYTSIQGTVHRHDMVKTIDHSGEVLVLRPDATIPLMLKMVNEKEHPIESRYFYTLNVFRHSFGSGHDKERMQAGVEYFGNNSVETDAEMIALAIHSLKDLAFDDFKIELGHAGFFKELIDPLTLTPTQLNELKGLIQTKNIIEINPFLNKLDVHSSLKQAIQTIPLLYGHPREVLKRAMDIAYSKQMKNKIKRLHNIYDLLKAYGFEKYIVIDLGLINHMDYYSGIIFQGFANSIGKPVLMGGRYDQLAKQFQASIPAIGFATDINVLLSGLPKREEDDQHIDIILTYANEYCHQALTLASILREKNYRVLTSPLDCERYKKQADATINVMGDSWQLIKNNKSYNIQSIDDITKILT